MGELADFLSSHEASFRRSRLPALYSDFRAQRTLNPDGYRANILAWRQALAQLAAHGRVSHHGSQPSLLVLTMDNALLRSLEFKDFGQPLSLGTVVREAVADKEFIPLGDFTKLQQSVYQRSWGSLPWNAVGWTLRQLGVVDPSRGDDKLPVGQFVLVKNLEAAAQEWSALIADKTSRFERVFTKEEFRKNFATALFEGQRLSDSDIDVFLRFLSRDKGLIEFDGQTIRIKGTGEQGGISEEDASIASLKELIESLKHQTDLLNARIDELSRAAKEAVARKNRIAALGAIKSKKTAETSLAARYTTLNQLEEVAAKIERAVDNVQMIKVMESSGSALASLNAQVGGMDRVESVMDRLRDQMSSTDEVSAILSESTGVVVDEGEIDDELEAMEAQEREKEEKTAREKEAAQLQKKLDELPDVPTKEEEPARERKAQTPTSETGIGTLSISENKEPLPAE